MFRNDSLASAPKKIKHINNQLEVSSYNIFEKHQTVIFMAPEKDAGNTTSVISSAYYLSQCLAAKTVIVDGNPIEPELDSLFNISKSPGLFDVLNDDTISYENVIHSTDVPFDIVPAGSDISNKINSSPRGFEGFLDYLKKRYDCILFDACPVSSSHYFMRHLKCFNGVIIVVECERTRWEVAQHLKEKIIEANGNTIGVILNKRQHYIPSWIYKHIF